jgi:CRP/FNR family transcriptional regulator, nitrogen fixation regulation protein
MAGDPQGGSTDQMVPSIQAANPTSPTDGTRDPPPSALVDTDPAPHRRRPRGGVKTGKEGSMAYVDRSTTSCLNATGVPVGGLADGPWSELIRMGRSKTLKFQSHEVIFYEGDPATRFYEVTEGALMLFKLLPDGRRQVVEVLSAGALFGIAAHDVYDCSAETLVPTSVRAIERRDLDASPSAQRHVTSCLLTQLETLHDHAVLLGRKSAFERVATFLMRFVPQRGIIGCIGPQTEKDESVIVLTMTRQEIADYLGLTIETVSRVISDLRRRGVITIEKQDRIRITKVCGICQLTGAH